MRGICVTEFHLVTLGPFVAPPYMMPNYKDLEVWKKAHALNLNVQRGLGSFRGNTALKNQIARSAQSVPATIVEGSVKGSDPEFARYLYISLGSATELEYHIGVAHDLGLLQRTHFQTLATAITEVEKMLNGLLNRVDPKRAEDKRRKLSAPQLKTPSSSPPRSRKEA